MKISWMPPKPRDGLAGTWDKFIGPGATDAELWLQFAGGILLTAVITIPLLGKADSLNWSASKWLLFLLIAFDLSGGILTNATATAKRWYHRPGQRFRDHFGFVAVHGLHLVLVAWIFRGGDWGFAGVNYIYLTGGTAVILRTPLYLKRPMALLIVCGSLLLNSGYLTTTPEMGWFIPFFYLKLLVAHLLPEAPFQSDEL